MQPPPSTCGPAGTNFAQKTSSRYRPGSLGALLGSIISCSSTRQAAAADLGREAAAIALSIAPGRADARCVQGMLHSAAGQLDEAASAFELALAVEQRLAIAHGFAGYNAAFLGRADETLSAVERARRLDNVDQWHGIWLFFGGFAE